MHSVMMINDGSFMLKIMRCIAYILMIYKHDVSDVDDDMCLVYVLNELNFCHVLLELHVSVELLMMFEKL